MFVQQSSSYRSPVLKKGQTCRCQPVTTVREPFCPQLPFLQMVRSMKSVSFPMLESGKAEVWQTPQTLCWEEPSFLIHQGLPRILSFSGITVPLPVQSKNEQCLLRNVESRESLSLADTSDLVLGRALVADAAVSQASRNPVATGNHVACSSSEQE